MKKILNVIMVLLIVAGACGTYFFYTKYQKTQAELKDPGASAKVEAKVVAEKVSKLIELPSDEDPQLLTITDADLEKFKDQAFIQNVKTGDKTLVFAKKKVAIIYRESDNKIINVVTLVTAAPEASPEATKSAEPSPSVKAKASPEAVQ